MKNEIKNHGLVVEKVLGNLDDTHFLLGANSKLGVDILQADGNWLPYIPAYEPQFTPNYETYGCTVFGTYNALEVLMKKLHGGDYNYAERFTYIPAEIRNPGGDPHQVIEIIRKNGLVPQALMPLTDTYDQFIHPDPLTPDLIDEGLKFLNDKEVGHEWVFTNNPNTADRVQMLLYALQRGTVAVSVTAWYQDADGLYIDNGQPNCHWVALVDMELRVDGKYYPIIIDSYDLIMNGVSTAFKKTLHPEHKMVMAKRYAITPKVALTDAQKKSFLAQLLDLLKKLFFIQTEVDALKKQEDSKPVPPPVVATTPFPPAPPVPKYLWDTPTNVRHSVRVICDEEKLSVEDKNDMCATVQAESGFKLTAKNENKVNGKVVSTDWGLCQWNDYYHGKEITPDEALHNPEKAVRLMCKYWKMGETSKQMWIAYKNGSYRKYL